MSAFSPTTATTSAVVGQAPQGMRDMYERIVGRQKGSQVSRYLSRFIKFCLIIECVTIQGTKHQPFSPLKEQEAVVATSNSIKNKFLNLFSKESAQVFVNVIVV